MTSSRTPDYSLGRFFVSPTLGCSARCSFCYIFSEGYNHRPVVNIFGADNSLNWIKHHEQFCQGRDGSIISIGAWGDPFPRGFGAIHAESLQWLRMMCSLGNPIQIMSRFLLSESVIDEVVSCQTFPNQILFSTSLSTLKKWRDYERGSDPPEDRLLTLQRFSQRGVSVNVMIKPFLLGVTDRECADIGQALVDAGISFCVVGSLHWNTEILATLDRVHEGGARGIVAAAQREPFTQLFDCTSEKVMRAFPSSTLDEFIAMLQQRELRVFKKSAYVNLYILNKNNDGSDGTERH